ncbi:hypothetical protein FYK55_01940 [Roseiconus nitratireducens]|uniref:Uncharacterized protein n=1 Tax=Roseiconus nitratireducens TaxID=2605748 RepID=A0A5M6DLT9_9BACT|nr:hypothetical protein [Roseiconus nitratireducens]KAA5547189.1 hypothetical protein FYK55_01940 [Roseiconus nitratireducens]
MADFTDAELIAFLDEALSDERSTELESALRRDGQLRDRLVAVRGREMAGLHTLGAIWRRSRLSCPSREELGQFLLETLPEDHADYIRFHLKAAECRYCLANLADLQAAAQSDESEVRRRKYFQTSAGYLK